MIIEEKAYPRAGLVGNPSDGFYGKTIAFTFTNFSAAITLYESPRIELVQSKRDHSRFESVHDLVEDVRLYGYYGGIRLLKASIKKFHDYCSDRNFDVNGRNFTVCYDSNIPHLVGLAGSSAIITACMRAMMRFYDVRISKPELANLVLSAEKDELGISAGLQDRVVQAYQGVVYMDFAKSHMEKEGFGRYEEIDASLLPPLYIAYRADLSEVSEVVHNDLTGRFLAGDSKVLDAVDFWAELTDRVRTKLLEGKTDDIGSLLDANFDRRAALYPITRGNQQMIEAARKTGASAKFTGSGGAIVGTYHGEPMFNKLKEEMARLNTMVVKPRIAPAKEEN